MNDTDLLFSRRPNPDRIEVETRPRLSVPVANVLDAYCHARALREGRRISRDALIVEIVTAWAADRHKEASLVLKLAGGNPITSDSLEEDNDL